MENANNPKNEIKARPLGNLAQINFKKAIRTMETETDVFTEIELNSQQIRDLAAARQRIRVPRTIWVDGEKVNCLRIGIGNGHLIAQVKTESGTTWRSIKAGTVRVTLCKPKLR